MQRFVPGAKAQPEQHCWPPQTLGLNKERHKKHKTQFQSHTDILLYSDICITNWLQRPFQIILMWLAFWYWHCWDYTIIAFQLIKISGRTMKLYLSVDPQVPVSVTRESRVKTNTELSEPWRDYVRHTGHEKHPASSINHWANERWQVLNCYNWILCTL